ncbi:Uncharacterized protein Fot_01038 [Forsythia ovata]|uniref:Uncharacterized protein n=1 Tax=Forsythia ovata TaxID=205694 RepID=A0ABD1X2W5_9LAMI
MLTSIFSSFDAFCAESLGYKVSVFSSPAVANEDVQKQGQGVVASTKIDGEKKESKKLEDNRQRRHRFAPEFDGRHPRAIDVEVILQSSIKRDIEPQDLAGDVRGPADMAT